MNETQPEADRDIFRWKTILEGRSVYVDAYPELEDVAKAMAKRREELIQLPLARIWRELALAAIQAQERAKKS